MDNKIAMNRRTLGFTLIETIVVIILLIVLSAFVSIFFSSSHNLYAQAKLLASDIRYAQSLSMTHGERYRFVKLSATSYTVQNGTGASITMPSGGTAVGFSAGVIFGALSGFISTIVFDTRGMPYADSSTTPMNATATIPLIKGSEISSVTINPETGSVSP